jgi:hypothetical protein
MGFIEYVIASIDEATDVLVDLIEDVYGKKDTDAEADLGNLLDCLKDNLFVFIEYPYVDKLYRDTYYSYFSSKHNDYHRDCIRVSLFEAEIQPLHFRSIEYQNLLQEAFRGFFIVRPTFPSVIGRTLISRHAYADSNFLVCSSAVNVLVNGFKLDVQGFPFSSQDGEAISCAETTIWALMEYFGNKYPEYKPTSPSAILNILNETSRERLLPSTGLTVDQISFALKKLGFGAQIFAREAYEEEFENIIAIFIESGIPLISFLSFRGSTSAHANLIIGHEPDNQIDFSTATKSILRFGAVTKRYVDIGSVDRRFVINDDNLTPYTKVRLNNPGEFHNDPEFAASIISSIIVPLNNHIYLDVTKAKKLILSILSDADFGFIFNNDFIFRFFLASSRSFKDHVSKLPGLNGDVKDAIILSRMPKFIWCAEIYFKNDFQHDLAKGLIIIDATEANQVRIDSLIFAGYPNRIITKLGKQYVTLAQRLNEYRKFTHNLQ